MTKFFLQGPIAILPKDSPINGLVSLPFLCMLCLNCMFGFRVICIENAFFTSYRYQKYHQESIDNIEESYSEKRIDPIIPIEYRLITYLLPSMVSFIINFIRLVTTCSNFMTHVIKFPQILLASCFTPIIFEGCKENESIRIWKIGSVLNGIFIGCSPQIVLLMMDFHRGVHYWDFIELDLELEGIFEINDALFKSNYGNSMFAVVSGLSFFFLIFFTFFTERVFKSNGIYCKCCTILCFPCPQNCFNFKQQLSLIKPIEDEYSQPNIAIEPGSDKSKSTEITNDFEDALTKIYFYSKTNKTWLWGQALDNEKIEFKEVKFN